MTRDELFAMADTEIHAGLTAMIDDPRTAGVIVFQNQNLSSPNVGHLTFVSYGPGRTFKTIEDGKRIGTLPSNFEYPIGAYTK